MTDSTSSTLRPYGRLRKRLSSLGAFSVAVLVALPLTFGPAVSGESSEPTVSPTPTSAPYSSTLPIVVDAPSVLVVDLARGTRLFEKDASLPVQLPALNKSMTALLALEQFPLDTMVTISKVAADADGGKLGLKRGEKYPLEYLLLGMMLQDSDAAAIAVAELVSGEESLFVEKMDAKAVAYGMAGTVFENSTGEDAEGQKTTVEDAVRFYRYALAEGSFERIFDLRDSLYFLPDKSSRHFTTRLDSAWSFIDTLTGGLRSDSATRVSAACTAHSRDFTLLCVVADAKGAKVVSDLENTVAGCFTAYESAVLVTTGDTFPARETVAGVDFGLVFHQTVTYVRPVGVDYLKDARYESLGKTTLPIRSSQAVGKAVFEMTDGSTINVDLYPERDIWSPSSFLDRVQSLVEANRGLTNIIVFLLVLLALAGFIRLAEILVRRGRLKRAQRRSAGRTLRR